VNIVSFNAAAMLKPHYQGGAVSMERSAASDCQLVLPDSPETCAVKHLRLNIVWFQRHLEVSSVDLHTGLVRADAHGSAACAPAVGRR
jgi:hypothetical protein